jgi:salicylate hydroxylase
MTRSLDVLIVGAGLGGLFAATVLAQRGMAVTVCERAPALGEAGAGIQISPNGARLLRRIGALRTVEQAAFQPEAAEMRDGRTGATILHLPLGALAEERWGAPYLQVHRADLLAALEQAARAAGVTIRLGAAVAAVREALFGPEAPRFTGQIAWRGIAPAEALPRGLVNPTATVWTGPGRHLVTYYLRRGECVNVVAVEERDAGRAEDWRAEGDPAEMRAAFAGWAPGAAQVLEAMDTCLLWGLYDRPAMPEWTRGRAALLGDACHPMLPFMAQGAVQAFEDGAALARCLSAETPVPEGLRRYAASRRARATRVQETARRNGRLFHARGAVERAARFAPLAIGSRLAPRVAMSRLDWLYGHVEPA